jgi:hypothetical protein
VSVVGGEKKMKASNESVRLKKSFVDNNFTEKQIIGFTEWMNYTFNKADLNYLIEENEITDTTSGMSDTVQNISAMKVMKLKRDEAKIRQTAFETFNSLSNVISAVDHEVSEGRISLREDPDLLADLGLQAIFCKLLFSYETVWLRLGLEVIFGEILSLPQTSPKIHRDESSQVCLRKIFNLVTYD